jgi:hypothetical protein
VTIFNIFKRSPGKLRRASLADCTQGEPTDAAGNRRIIRAARTLETINEAARNGFRPLVKPVQPNNDIHWMVALFQSANTGEIELSGDIRSYTRGHMSGVMVMDYTRYYPYHFPSPFAAYVLPSDLAVGEEVWLEDLIEDLVAMWGNQGYHPRLEAAPAIWTGEDFTILFDPRRDAQSWIG